MQRWPTKRVETRGGPRNAHAAVGNPASSPSHSPRTRKSRPGYQPTVPGRSALEAHRRVAGAGRGASVAHAVGVRALGTLSKRIRVRPIVGRGRDTGAVPEYVD